MEKNKRIWKLCIVFVIVIIAVTFSPLVIAPGKISPSLFGLPYTLWVGILFTVALVVITLIAGNALPNEEEDGK